MVSPEKPYALVDTAITDAVISDIDQGITTDTIAAIRQDITKRVDRRHLAQRAKVTKQRKVVDSGEALGL
jgi:hypothetical protein